MQVLKRLKVASLIVMVAATSPASAHDMANMGGDVGQVHLATSCSGRAATAIDRGTAYLYSFWYDAARRSFREAEAAQPGCAMAWWGEAMSDWQQIERLPDGSMLDAGRVAVAQARAAPVQTPRERAYVDAVANIFDPAPRAAAARVLAFSDAMAVIARDHPEDRQAPVFEAVTLLSDELPDDPTLARARRALALLDRALVLEPDNPGIIHFIIHATDNPRMASLGLVAARRYAALAPASAHARHMPGHIFARLGLWREDLSANLASKAAAEQPAVLHREAQNRLHAMEFLQYAYLQVGEWDRARVIGVEAATIRPDELSRGMEGYYAPAEAGFVARQLLETRDWAAASQLMPSPELPPSARRVLLWAKVVGAGHVRDAKAATDAEHAYWATYTSDQQAAARQSPTSSWTEVQAWARFAQGDMAGAATLLRPCADLQDQVGKGEVELPAREMLGDMLQLGGKPDAALSEYRRSLTTDPGRFNTLVDAARLAAQLQLPEATGYLRTLHLTAPNPSPAAVIVLRTVSS